MLIVAAESLTTNAVLTAGASTAAVALNTTRNGVNFSVDPAATTNVYLLLGAGTASATNFTFALAPGGAWDGEVARGVVWRGAVQIFGTGAKVGVAEV